MKITPNGFLQRAGPAALRFKSVKELFIFCYTAGRTEEDALRMTTAIHKRGYGVISDILGEEVLESEVAKKAARRYLEHVRKLGALKILYPDMRLAISLKLSQLGLKLDLGLVRSLLKEIFEEALIYGVSLEIDMEGPETINPALSVICALNRISPHYRAAVAANQSESEKYLRYCRTYETGVRLVKGSYEGNLASGRETDENLVRMADQALAWGLDTALGTHDRKIISRFPGVALQMLLGVRPFAKKDFVYMPWGEDPTNYLGRRWKEGVRSNVAHLFLRNTPEAVLWRVLYTRNVTI